MTNNISTTISFGASQAAPQTMRPITPDQAMQRIDAALRRGGLDQIISGTDVATVTSTLEQLAPKDLGEVIRRMDAGGQLAKFTGESDDLIGGLSQADQSKFFAHMAKNLDGGGLSKLSIALANASRGTSAATNTTDLGSKIASFSTLSQKQEFLAAVNDKIGRSVRINPDDGSVFKTSYDVNPLAKSAGRIISTLPSSAAETALQRMSDASLRTILNEAVPRSVTSTYSGMGMGNAIVQFDASGFSALMKTASSLKDADLKARIVEQGAVVYMGVLSTTDGIGVTLLNRQDTLKSLATAMRGVNNSVNLPTQMADAPPTQAGLILDLTQMTLDVIGIVEPTPFADITNTLISAGRGDALGAVLSAVGIIPYVGDLAKVGKLGKWAKTVSNAVELAAKNPEFLAKARPALEALQSALHSIDIKKLADVLPDGVKAQADEIGKTISAMRDKLDGLLGNPAPNSIDIPPIAFGRVQSRINLRNGSQAEGAGWNHVIADHFNPAKTGKSQFSVSSKELRDLLQSPEVVSSPIVRILPSNDGPRFVREVVVQGKSIGIDVTTKGPTSTLTVLCDEYGNLVTAFPGKLKT